MTPEELQNRFSYHAPNSWQVDAYQALRDKARELAELMDSLCPDSRELSVAMTQLETSIFWANAAIARNPLREGA